MRIQSSLSKGGPTIACFWQRLKDCRGWESLEVEKIGFRFTPVGDLWHREAGGRLTGNRATYMISLGSIFGFFWWVLSWKLGRGSKEIEKLSVIGQILTILGQMLQGLCGGQNSIITCGLAIVCFYVFDHLTVMVYKM